jgi:HNH endonuclease
MRSPPPSKETGDGWFKLVENSTACYPCIYMDNHTVTVISETIQEFLGLRYYLCGKYFQREGVRLHVLVWTTANGRPPQSGYDIHHKDEDRANNQPWNLEEKQKSVHISEHFKGKSKDLTAQALEAAKAWHGSEEGAEWHRKHYEKFADRMHQRGEFTCAHCGQKFETEITGKNRFCSNKCKTRWRFLSGIDDEDRSCLVCGNAFRANRYIKKKTCSRACGGVAIGRAKLGLAHAAHVVVAS